MHRLTCLVIALVFILSAGPALAQDRVLIVGDRWAGGFWEHRTMRAVFAANGRPDITEWGQFTALGGTTAEGWSQPSELQVITQELNSYPSLDTVQLTIGGNDFLAPAELGGWFAGMTPEQEAAMNARITGDITTIVNHVLAHSAAMEVVVSLYDYVNFRDFPGACAESWVELGSPTPRRINEALNRFHDSVAAAFASNSRVTVVDHRGLMQFTYGIPDEGIAPGTITPPGDLDRPSPRQALDDCIHLIPDGLYAIGQQLWQRYYDQRFNGATPIFTDGFEGGNTSAWSASAP